MSSENQIKSIPDHIKYFINDVFPSITKQEADLIETVLKWDDEKRMAFMMAKRIFEEKDE